MRLGIMQPYFFPYAGYFDLIIKSDRWVVFDVVKFTRKTWMSRNVILEPNKGHQYVSVAVVRSTADSLTETQVAEFEFAATKVLRQLKVYEGRAPHYDAVRGLVERAFSRFREQGSLLLRDLNVVCLDETCRHLGIPFTPENCSSLDLDFSAVDHAGAWALEIADQLGADSYLNPPGGVGLFRAEDWRARGIELEFTGMPQLTYDTGNLEFRPNASILDCMMWLTADEIRGHLASRPIHRAEDLA